MQSVESLSRKKTDSPEEGGNRTVASLKTSPTASALPHVSCLLAYPADFGLSRLRDCLSQFLKSISVSLPLLSSPLPTGCLSLKNLDQWNTEWIC